MRLMRTTAIALSVAALAFSASNAKAEDAGTTIDATVQNAFTFTEDSALNFGTIVAISDPSETASYVVDSGTGPAAPTTTGGSALIIELTPGAAGNFSISGAAPNTALTIQLPANTTMNCGACSGSQPDFDLTAWEDSEGGTTAVPATTTTDGSGQASFTVGATLSTRTSANPYEDGTYSAAYTVSVNY